MKYNNEGWFYWSLDKIRTQNHVRVLTSDSPVCSVCLQTTLKASGESSACRRTDRINRRWDGTTRRNCSSTSPRKVLVLISVVFREEAKNLQLQGQKVKPPGWWCQIWSFQCSGENPLQLNTNHLQLRRVWFILNLMKRSLSSLL